MRFAKSAEDFLREELVAPGWYPALIKKVEQVKSKGGTNAAGEEKPVVDMLKAMFVITDGPDHVKGKAQWQNYPENIPGFMCDLLEQGFGAIIDRKKGFDEDITPQKLEGKKVDIQIIRGQYNGKPTNNIGGYRPYTGSL